MCCNDDVENNEYVCGKGKTPCGHRTVIFKRRPGTLDNVVESFIDWVLLLHSKKNFGEINIVSHNGARFDNFIVFTHLLERSDKINVQPPVRKGSSIVSMTIEDNITFKDSYLYLLMALKQLPSTFGFESFVKKGLFPYKFLTQDNLGYIGECPPISEFDTLKMTDAEVEELKTYINSYAENGTDYCLMDECVSYCISDVVILRLSFQSYRSIYIKDFDIDPLRSACTVASLCFKIFQSKFLKKDLIPVLDRYRGKCHSYKGINLTSYIGYKLGVDVHHARSSRGELLLKIDGKLYFADGSFRCPESGELIIISFHGCYYHAHKKCIQDWEIKESFRDGISAKEIYESTLRADEEKSKKYRHIVMWECTYNALVEGEISSYETGDDITDVEPNFFEDFADYVARYGSAIRYKALSLDDALTGGRTNAVRLHIDVKDDPTQRIVYKDICSLYPFIQKGQFDFPVGPPEIKMAHQAPTSSELEREIKDDVFFGIARVDVLAPSDLEIPVLYIKIKGKLVFPLCTKCAKRADHSKECKHKDKQRKLSGSYASVELKLALRKGYRIVEVFEVWYFQRDSTVFMEYQKRFLRDKIEASGVPPEYENNVQAYIDLIKETDGIELREDKLKYSKAIRNLSKLGCNSLWGKFSMNVRPRETKICDTQGEMMDIAFNGQYKVLELIVADTKAAIVYENINQSSARSPRCVNLPISIFTTSHARVQLYHLMETVGPDKICYFDTDSIMHLENIDETLLPVGQRVGDLTDELLEFGPNARATGFVSTGPKSYRLRIETESGVKYICKSKGITLNRDTRDEINYESMLSIIKEGITKEVTTDQFRLGRFEGPFKMNVKKNIKTCI